VHSAHEFKVLIEMYAIYTSEDLWHMQRSRILRGSDAVVGEM